jgi:hypothetical protein
MKNLWMIIFALSILTGLTLAPPSHPAAEIQQQNQQPNQQPTGAATPDQAQVMREYRGIKLGMNPEKVRDIMGKPELKEKDKDRFKLGGNDLLTIYYDGDAVKAIQLYFTDPKHAPAWAEVVGDTEVVQTNSGAKSARRVISEENFWVSMYQNKDGTVTTITISR